MLRIVEVGVTTTKPWSTVWVSGLGRTRRSIQKQASARADGKKLIDCSCPNRGTKRMGGGEGGKVGILEILIFQPGNSLRDALDVRQAVVVLPVKLCHVLRGNRTEPAAKRNGESGESCP